MKIRAWVTTTIGTEVEWDDKDELGYVDVLKEKLAQANIAEFNGTEVDTKSIEKECPECGEFSNKINEIEFAGKEIKLCQKCEMNLPTEAEYHKDIAGDR